MSSVEADREHDTAAIISIDRGLLDACTTFLAVDTSPRDEAAEPNDDQAADRLDHYYQALEKVTATPALTAVGRRMKATVALRAMQSITGDLQPEERCGVSALADLLEGRLSTIGEPIDKDRSLLANVNEELAKLGGIVGIFNHLARSPHDVTAWQWDFIGGRLRECHARLEQLLKVALEHDAADRSAERAALNAVVALEAAATKLKAARAATPPAEAINRSSDTRFLRRLLRNTARATIETFAEED